MFPLASRMPVSMASLLRSDSVKPFKNSSSYGTRGKGKESEPVAYRDHVMNGFLTDQSQSRGACNGTHREITTLPVHITTTE